MIHPHPVRTVPEICKLFKLTDSARELQAADVTPAAYFDRLVSAAHYADARRFLAHALPPRRAIWWALFCLHHSASQKPFSTEAEQTAFVAVQNWIADSSEANRRIAQQTGWAAKPSTAAGSLALAVYLSGGSLSRPGLPTVLAEPHLCGRMCGAVVYLASVRFDPARYKWHLRDYLAIGRDVAAGVLPLPTPDPVEPPTEPTSTTNPVEALWSFASVPPSSGV